MECLLDGALLSVPSLRFSTSSVLFPRRTRKPSLIYCSRSNSNEHRERIRRAICCNSVRRHQRRRDRGFGTRTKELFRNAGNSGEAAKDLLANDDTVVFTLDPQNVKQRVENFTESAHRAVRTSTARVVTLSKGLVNDGRMLLNDLCSSVSVDRDKRVVITLRRSSIDFAVSALLWSSLFILAWKIICKVSEKYSWGWEENLRPRSVVKRDRSLGGREVLVGRNIVNIHNRRQWTGSLDDRGRKFNPLDAVKTSLSEKDFIDQNRGKPLRKADRELSEWWPSSPLSHVSSGSMGIKDAEQKASLVLRSLPCPRKSYRS
ncbi:hypothetical protein KP509_04G067400 [Ceratopteris richardii]|uniref:Uncharacterized protein n=1 Tax=Ceratopteris richardii TaxID=49495 RepID=A0A8T2UXQ6_CERRI|nr:hypothetical protein KP509_04G067400 [Ceratopteris richardii]